MKAFIVLCVILQIEAQKHESFSLEEPYLQRIGKAFEEGFVSAKVVLNFTSTKYLFVKVKEGLEHLQNNINYSQASRLAKEEFELKEYERQYNNFLQSLSQPTIPQDRNERAIVTLTVGLVFLFASVASAVSLYLSLETQHRMDVIVEALDKSAEIFEEQLAENEHFLQNFQYEKLALEDISSEIQFESQLGIWQTHFSRLKTVVDQEKAITSSVLKNKLPYQFFDLFDDFSIFNHMEKQCQRHNMTLNVSQFEFRYEEDRVETSGVVKKGSLDIYLSFPVLLKEHEVYKLIPTPIAIPGTDKIQVISDNDEKEYILKEVVKDERAKQNFALISESQIKKDCKEKLDTFECKNLGVDLSLDTIKNSCLGKLMLKEPQQIEDFCNIEVKKSINKAEKLGKNRFITYVNKPVDAHVYCKERDGTSITRTPFDQFTMSGTEIHSLKPNCEAVSEYFTLRAELDIDFDPINQTQLKTNFRIFNEKLPTKLTNYINHIDLGNQHGKNMKVLLKEYKQKIEESKNSPFPTDFLSFLFKGVENLLCFLTWFVPTVIIVFIFYKCCYKKKK